MNNFQRIKTKLGYTAQKSIADDLGMSQPNVSKLENGQEIQPEVARKLVALAKQKNISLSFDEIYSTEECDHGKAA